MVADTQHFFQGGNSHNCFLTPSSSKVRMPKQACLPANGLGRFAIEGHFANGAVHLQQFIDSLAATVAGVVAIGATAATEKSRLCSTCAGVKPDALISAAGGVSGSLHFGTDDPHQTLSHDGNNRGGDQKRGYADILHSCNSAGRIVRV